MANSFEGQVGFTELWYNAKIKEKKERVLGLMDKIAEMLGYIYPDYENYLTKKVEQNIRLCKFDEPFIVDVKKPHGNYWKFKCFKQLVKAEIGSDEQKSVWTCKPHQNTGHNLDNPAEFPPYIIRIVEAFNRFMQEGETPSCEVGRDSAESEEWVEFIITGNDNEELLLQFSVKNISPERVTNLKMTYEEHPNIKSIFLKNVFKSYGRFKTSVQKIFGADEIIDKIEEVDMKINPTKLNFWTNLASVKLLSSAVKKFLPIKPSTTIFFAGSGVGITSLILAKHCKEVIAFDNPTENLKAKELQSYNGIENVNFVSGHAHDIIDDVFGDLRVVKRFIAILNLNSKVSDSIEMTRQLRRMLSLKKVLLISTLEPLKKFLRVFLEFADPGKNDAEGNPFLPSKASIVDTTPFGSQYVFLLLLERRQIDKITGVELMPDEEAFPELNIDSKDIQKLQEKIADQEMPTIERPDENEVDDFIDKLFRDSSAYNNQVIMPPRTAARCVYPKPEKKKKSDIYCSSFTYSEIRDERATDEMIDRLFRNDHRSVSVDEMFNPLPSSSQPGKTYHLEERFRRKKNKKRNKNAFGPVQSNNGEDGPPAKVQRLPHHMGLLPG